MDPFVRVTGLVAPMDRINVDTDQIIPKQFLKQVEKAGFGHFAFFDWRYDADGQPNPEFELNRPEYKGASILVAGRNFGCGSSREHAAWALKDYGFRVIIAPSFADIFFNNCFKNGMLLITLPEADVDALLDAATSRPGYRLTVDLERQVVEDGQGFSRTFEVDAFRRYCLLNGLDDIGLTLRHTDDIATFETKRPSWLPKTVATT